MGQEVSAIGVGHTYPIAQRDIVLTVGTFDGVHLGHRHLVQQVVQRARERGCLSGAVTFHPHPRAVVTGQAPPYLSTLDERLALLRGLGLDVVVALPFTRDLAGLSARDFMRLLCRPMRLREVWVGADFTLGREREGTVARLAEIGQELGYRVQGVQPLVLDGQTVSSSLIRQLVGQGQVEAAARLLKRPYHVSGTATPADSRDGHKASCTATVVLSAGLAVPATGDYAGSVRSGGSQWLATVHVGPDPASAVRRLRVRVPDFADDLHGQSLQVEFLRCLEPAVPMKAVRAPSEKAAAQRRALSPA